LEVVVENLVKGMNGHLEDHKVWEKESRQRNWQLWIVVITVIINTVATLVLTLTK
jgi:hypothetical protein